MIVKTLPTWDQCKWRADRGIATPLAQFIYENETDEQWRAQLKAALEHYVQCEINPLKELIANLHIAMEGMRQNELALRTMLRDGPKIGQVFERKDGNTYVKQIVQTFNDGEHINVEIVS